MSSFPDLDRQVRQTAWELYLLERMGMANTEKYKKMKLNWLLLVNKLRSLRNLPPYQEEEQYADKR